MVEDEWVKIIRMVPKKKDGSRYRHVLQPNNFRIAKIPHGWDDSHPLQVKHETGETSIVLFEEGH